MAVRASMLPLIQRVRDLIGDDPDTQAEQVFSDQKIQNRLDEYQEQARYLYLREEGTRPPGGGFIQYLDFYADRGDWESDAKLFDASYIDLTSLFTGDYIVGHWVASATVNWPVYLTGRCYDVYGAAADLLEVWAAKRAQDYDFSDKQVSFKRSQVSKALLEMAQTYRMKQRPQIGCMTRDDVTG